MNSNAVFPISKQPSASRVRQRTGQFGVQWAVVGLVMAWLLVACGGEPLSGTAQPQAHAHAHAEVQLVIQDAHMAQGGAWRLGLGQVWASFGAVVGWGEGHAAVKAAALNGQKAELASVQTQPRQQAAGQGAAAWEAQGVGAGVGSGVGQVSTWAVVTGVQSHRTHPARAVAKHGQTTDATPTLRGVLSAPLRRAEEVRVYAGPTLLGAAVTQGTTWQWSVPAQKPLPLGTHALHARVYNAYSMLQSESEQAQAWDIQVVSAEQLPAVPAQTGPDPLGAAMATHSATASASTTDSPTPSAQMAHTIAAWLGSAWDAATQVVWTFCEGAGSAAAGVSERVGAWLGLGEGSTAAVAPTTSAAHTATATVWGTGPVHTSAADRPLMPGAVTTVARIEQVFDDQNRPALALAPDGQTTDATPQVTGQISAPLGLGEEVRVYADGVYLGTAVTTGTRWVWQSADALPPASYGLVASVYNAYSMVNGSSGNLWRVQIAPVAHPGSTPPSTAASVCPAPVAAVAAGDQAQVCAQAAGQGQRMP